MNQQVEIRIPTYKRPDYLKRAIHSLLKQTHKNWKAIILDDSPEGEGFEVVNSFSDDRLAYKQNSENLGGAENIDQAFRRQPFFDGSEFASILEDDNWFYPELLMRNIEDMNVNKVSIMLRNQQTWLQEEDEEPEETDRTTRGKWFQERIYQPEELHAFLLFHEGISNGGLFWRINLESNMVVGPTVEDPGLQEFLRTLQISEPLYFASEPLCAWAKMPDSLVTRFISKGRTYSLGKLAIMRHVYKFYGASIVERAHQIALDTGHLRLFEEALIEIGRRSGATQTYIHVNLLERMELFLKTRLKEMMFRNPVRAYFKSKRR